jgi:diguanylate cyclase (GGDEF)-like protein
VTIAPETTRTDDAGDAAARLAHLAYHDPLTGLPNRAGLAERLHRALAAADRGGRLALLSIDLDGFKLVNDGLGHAAGDELLCQVARRLESVRRPADIVARHGGDEFVMVAELEGAADATAATAAIGRRIGERMEAPFTVADAEFRVGASVGAAIYPDDARDAEALHRHADWAMYQAKESGGGFAAFRDGQADPLGRMSMAAALRRGLLDGALHLEYQPIYNLSSRALVGLEALSRWRDPTRGAVTPDVFIPVAEKTGVINALGDWVLEQVCRDALAWEALGLRPNFGINVSPRQLQRPGFAADVAATVAHHGLDPRRFILELTETAWSLDANRTMPVLHELTTAGFVLALDDFGAGYSSLSRLRRLPVKVIKIDRSFMTDLPEDPQAVAIVEAILALANACHCDVVCEGVETEAQIAFLAHRQVRLVQGFGLARPQPVEAVTALLARELVAERRRGN